jgi:hypothetical protein
MNWFFFYLDDLIAAAAIIEAVAIAFLLWAMARERNTAEIWRDRWQAEHNDHAYTISHYEHMMESGEVQPRDDDNPTEREIEEQQRRYEELFGFREERRA